MTKQTFLMSLNDALSALSQKDTEEHVSFYREMIEDRMEEGLSEEEAVAAAGSVEEIAAQIMADISHSIDTGEHPKVHRKVWEILLLVLGSPLWLSLLLAAVAVILSLYVSLWAIILSLWAVFVSVVACAFALILSGIGSAVGGTVLTGIGVMGAGLACAGLSIFMFHGCKAATKGTWILTEKAVLRIRNRRKGRKCNE